MSYARTRIPKRLQISANVRPILPVPTTPAVRVLVVAVSLRCLPTEGSSEIEIAGADIGLVGEPVDREKQCHCLLGHRVRRIRGNAEHPDFSEAGPDIYIVEARAAQGDDPDPKRVPPTDDGFIQRSFVKYELSFCYSRTVWYKACPSTTLRVLIYNDHPFWRYSFPVRNTESFSLHSQIPLYRQYA